MAMMITKFHKLIQSRLLWIVFLVVIVFSFVIWGMADTSSSREQVRQDAGKLHGKGVDTTTFREARERTYFSLVLSTGRALSLDEQLEAYINDQAWKRIASRTAVRNHGLRAPDAMVERGIRNHPAFQEQGRFSSQIYLSTLSFLRSNMRITEQAVHEIIREDLELQLLQRSVSALAPVTPHETDQSVRMLTDRYTVQYAEIMPEQVADKIALTDEEIEAYYAADPERYKIPRKYDLAYVVFPYDDYNDRVPEISEEDIAQYYELNQSRYRIRTDDEEEGDEPVAQYRALEEVHGDILRELIREHTRRIALQEADDFVYALTPDRSGAAPGFEELRSEKGLVGGSIPPFTSGSRPDFDDAAGPIGNAALQLDLTPEFYFSDALEGEQGAYVVALERIIEPEIPPFEDVREQVSADARRVAVRKALEEMAQTFHKQVSAALESGQTFAETLETQGVADLKSAGPFSMIEAMYSEPLIGKLMPDLTTYSSGDLMDVVFSDDRALIVFLADRSPDDGAMLSYMRDHIQSGLAQRRSGLVFDAYQQHLLDEAGFENLLERTPREFEEEDDDDE